MQHQHPMELYSLTLAVLAYLDNEAQLAYIICHELAHFKMNHWKYTLL